MIFQVPLSMLQFAADTIRANPSLTREEFYAQMQSTFQLGLTQEQIEATIQQVTQALVDLQYVEVNHFDYIAPWIRALPSAQVEFMVGNIHAKYLENLAPLLKQERIDLAAAHIAVLDAKIVLATADVAATLNYQTQDEQYRHENFLLLKQVLEGQKAGAERTKAKLESN